VNSSNMERFATRTGVILVVSGSAVGLGNFLRFPGLAAKYGGGLFMIPYFISMLLIGITVCWCEWTLGRYGGERGYNSSPGIFRAVSGRRGGQYFGIVALLIPIIIYMYYVYIESWCLGYAWYYLCGVFNSGPFATGEAVDYKNFFANHVGMGENGSVLADGLNATVVCLLIAFAINFYLIYRGLSKGIETFCKIAMPALIFAAILVLIRVLTLGTPNPELPEQNVSNGLGFMWNLKLPEGVTFWSWDNPLTDPEMWLEAAGQVFFSLSVGFGIVLTYSSYLRRKDDVVLSGLSASSTNVFCEVCLGGLITVPAAFIFLGPERVTEVAGSSIGLGFFTLPDVFERMQFGPLVGFVWFFLLFLAAVTSSISMLQPAIAFLEEGFNLGRRASVSILGLITVFGAFLVVYFSKDLIALDTMDFWVGTFLIFILGLIMVILFGWVIGIEKGMNEAHRGAHLRIPKVFNVIIKYVCPLYLVVIFILFIWKKIYVGYAEEGSYVYNLLNHPDVHITVGFVAILAVFLGLMIYLAGKRWDQLRPIKEGEEI